MVVGGWWLVVGGWWLVVGGWWSAIFAGAPRNALRPQAVDTGPVSTDRRKLPPQHKRLAATLPIHARIASMPIAASRPLSPSRRFDAHAIATVNEKVERRMAEAHGRHARAAYDVPMLCRPSALRGPTPQPCNAPAARAASSVGHGRRNHDVGRCHAIRY
ncbi:hypothetical protein AAFM48_14915 [Burkholderia pseudomallei]